MRRLSLLIPLLLLVLLPSVAAADYLTVSRPATLKAEPRADALVLEQLDRGGILRLLEANQSDGYYHAQPVGGGHAGWIYRSLVRRFPGEPEVPEGTGVTESTKTEPGSPSGGEDVSAFAIPNCPPEGSAKSPSLQALNKLKNRLRGPAPAAIRELTIQALTAAGDDRDRWSDQDASEFTGYVSTVKSGGSETCNCKTSDGQYYDTHIELTSGPNDESLPVIVEVTPAWRRYEATLGSDWSTAALKQSILHHYVRVRGWMFYDAQHTNNAENTNPEGEQLWRRTAWEVHPITGLQVVPSP